MKSLVMAVAVMLMLGLFGGAAAQTFGTKVTAGDPDVGLPLAPFGAGGITGDPIDGQDSAYLSYWDIGSTPGLYDDKDVVYLQFGSVAFGANRIVRANNIRMTPFEPNYPAGSKVIAGDSDMGQQLLPWGTPLFPAGATIGFYYMDVSGGSGYNIGDPIYLKAGGINYNAVTTNDIRITSVDDYPAGSRVSLGDTDGGKLVNRFQAPYAGLGTGGPQPTGTPTPIASLWFFNANGNTDIQGNLIYDYPDLPYLHIGPVNSGQNAVTPGDVRLF
jgi:hypothetical protein